MEGAFKARVRLVLGFNGKGGEEDDGSVVPGLGLGWIWLMWKVEERWREMMEGPRDACTPKRGLVWGALMEVERAGEGDRWRRPHGFEDSHLLASLQTPFTGEESLRKLQDFHRCKIGARKCFTMVYIEKESNLELIWTVGSKSIVDITLTLSNPENNRILNKYEEGEKKKLTWPKGWA